MSTRATYEFNSHSGSYTFYIHHDGDENGAAVYFFKAVNSKAAGGLADKFFRANEQAELTRNHDWHGDTAYQYTVTPPAQLTVRKYHEDPANDEYEYVVVWAGSLGDFINTHRDDIANYSRVVRIGGSLTTLALLEEEIETRKRSLAEYRAQFPTFIGNISSMESMIHQLEETLRGQKIAAGLAA